MRTAALEAESAFGALVPSRGEHRSRRTLGRRRPQPRPLALMDATAHAVDRRRSNDLWQFLELRVSRYVPSRAVPCAWPAATPTQASLAAHQQPDITAVFKPAPTRLRA